MSQRLRVLQLLRHAGDRGVTNGEFVDWRILRYSARIHQLREEGCEIRTEAGPGSRVRYVLVSEPSVERTASYSPDPPASPPMVGGVAVVPTDDGRKAPVAPGDAGLITRASTGGSLSTGTLFDVEPQHTGHYEEAA
jgi:hypothetical protein